LLESNPHGSPAIKSYKAVINEETNALELMSKYGGCNIPAVIPEKVDINENVH